MKSDDICPRTQTLLMLPKGDQAQAPDGFPAEAPGRIPYIHSRKDPPPAFSPKGPPQRIPQKATQHIPPDRHPSSATEKIPCMAPPGMHSFIEDGINLDTNLVCEP